MNMRFGNKLFGRYIWAASVKKQGCQVIEVENVEPEDGILTERRAVLPVADFVGACLCNRRPCGTG